MAAAGVTLYLPGGEYQEHDAKTAKPVSEILSDLDDSRIRPPTGYTRGGPIAVIGECPLSFPAFL